jgi:hypothetical protein
VENAELIEHYGTIVPTRCWGGRGVRKEATSPGWAI